MIALIPARGGSKGLPKKNIKQLLGKPLIAWTIEQAKACSYFDRVVVSTDDPEIAEIARSHAADVPFLRPPEFAQDSSPTIETISHCLDFFQNRHERSNVAGRLRVQGVQGRVLREP